MIEKMRRKVEKGYFGEIEEKREGKKKERNEERERRAGK